MIDKSKNAFYKKFIDFLFIRRKSKKVLSSFAQHFLFLYILCLFCSDFLDCHLPSEILLELKTAYQTFLQYQCNIFTVYTVISVFASHILGKTARACRRRGLFSFPLLRKPSRRAVSGEAFGAEGVFEPDRRVSDRP